MQGMPPQPEGDPTVANPGIPNGLAGEATAAFQEASSKETAKARTEADTLREARKGKPPGKPAAGAAEGTVIQGTGEEELARQASLTSELPPAQIPGYRLIRKIGQGTYGVVWYAEDLATTRTVAIKFFFRRAGQQWQLIQAEVRQLAMLAEDPGIIHLLDADPEHDPPYFVMRFAEQGSLWEKLHRKEPGDEDGREVRTSEPVALPLDEALPLFRQILEALAYVHTKGIRHCDLKPANILLDARGKPKVADFGQAHLSVDSAAGGSINLGTFYYMAPEQADLAKQIPDTRWDVYSLGAIFYRMVMGKVPRHVAALDEQLQNTVHLASRLDLYKKAVREAPDPGDIRRVKGMDRSLADIICRCLHLDPDKRYRSAADVLAALDQRERFRRIRPLLIFGLVASFVFLGVLGLLAYRGAKLSVDRSQEALLTQLQESDRATAGLMPQMMDGVLDGNIEAAAQFASSPRFVRKFQAVLDAFEHLKRPGQDFDAEQRQRFVGDPAVADIEDFLAANHRGKFIQWTLYEPKGTLLISSYLKEGGPTREQLRSIYGKSYAFRDYFHGLGRDIFPAPGERSGYFGRVGEPYVSLPFASTYKESGENLVIVTVTVLIPRPGQEKPDPKDPLGVLVGSLSVKDIASWLKSVEQGSGEHFEAALLDRRDHFVFHSHKESRERLLPQKLGEAPKKWDDAESPYQAMGSYRGLGKIPYRQQARNEGDFFATDSSISPKHRWKAVVLHRKDKVLEPLAELRADLQRMIWSGVGITAALLAGIWTWLWWALRRKERFGHA